MKAYLLNRRGYVEDEDIAPFKDDLINDLLLEPVLQSMAKNDNFIYQQCKRILLSPLTDRENILHRQSALRDAIRNKKTILSLYATVAEVVTDISNFRSTNKKKGNPLPAVRVIQSIEQLDLLAKGLERLKAEIVNTYGHFTGIIFRDFYDDFLKEFNTDFVQLVHEKTALLKAISNGGEIQISGCIGRGLKADGFLVNSLSEYQPKRKLDIMESLFSTKVRKNEIRVSYDDLQLYQDCHELEVAGQLHVASCFEGFARELMKLFDSLRAQLAFFQGCCNLHSNMTNMVYPVCFPEVVKGTHSIAAENIYDLGIALKSLRLPTVNDITGEDTLLYLITGTNNGGKTTFIRSAAVSQLMAQCGMFVPAKAMTTQIFRGIYTHFVRNEDETMTAGKLEEELRRLSRIVDHMKPESVIFLNESFATTSEREGAQIAEDILHAFFDNNVTCFFVTHIYTYAKKAYDEHFPRTQFLQAERTAEGERTFRITSGEPSLTGYGMEMYHEILGDI
ncbi:MAG: hypothetical protein IKI15_07170 [Lachnospiraceae bacterium]|nr:hypothetical protein [Lachnospiraceae bacterium]